MYAEQKEEEVKILEHSVDELESTINMLETKVKRAASKTLCISSNLINH